MKITCSGNASMEGEYIQAITLDGVHAQVNAHNANALLQVAIDTDAECRVEETAGGITIRNSSITAGMYNFSGGTGDDHCLFQRGNGTNCTVAGQTSFGVSGDGLTPDFVINGAVANYLPRLENNSVNGIRMMDWPYNTVEIVGAIGAILPGRWNANASTVPIGTRIAIGNGDGLCQDTAGLLDVPGTTLTICVSDGTNWGL